MPDNTETAMALGDDHYNTQEMILKHVHYTVASRKWGPIIQIRT